MFPRCLCFEPPSFRSLKGDNAPNISCITQRAALNMRGGPVLMLLITMDQVSWSVLIDVYIRGNIKTALQTSPRLLFYQWLWHGCSVEDVRGKIHVCKAQASHVIGYKSKTERGTASERHTLSEEGFFFFPAPEREGKTQSKLFTPWSAQHVFLLLDPFPTYSDRETKLLGKESEYKGQAAFRQK